MKNLMKTGLFALLLAFASCQKTDNPVAVVPKPVECKETIESKTQCKSCGGGETYIQCFSGIEGTVKEAKLGFDECYNRNTIYIEVNSQQYLPVLYKKWGVSPIRLFPCDANFYSKTDIGKKIKISGQVYNCVTGNHGLLSNHGTIFDIAFISSSQILN
jgi:hypothetical protein